MRFSTFVRLFLLGKVLSLALGQPALAQAINDCGEIYEGREAIVNYGKAHTMDENDANDYLESVIDCVKVVFENTGRADELTTIPSNALSIGGKPALDVFFPDVVRITYQSSGGVEQICSGVVIANDTILTAGHCACGRNYKATIAYSSNNPASSEQDENLNLTGNPVLFPTYSCSRSGSQAGRDFALLKMEPLELRAGGTKIVFSTGDTFPFRKLVIRPSYSVLKRKSGLENLYLVGYGLDSSGQLQPRPLGVFINLFSRHCNRGRVFQSRCRPFREFVLAKVRKAPGDRDFDSCGGDSGGPVFQMGKARIGTSDSDFGRVLTGDDSVTIPDKTLVGIVSRALQGVSQEYRGYCGGGGIYTTVGTRPVLEWLRGEKVDFCYQSDLGKTDCEPWQ